MLRNVTQFGRLVLTFRKNFSSTLGIKEASAADMLAPVYQSKKRKSP